MKKSLATFFVTMLVCLPSAASQAPTPPVCAVSPSRELVGVYPEHPLSPRQSLKTFDTVFLGEVAVPSRKCSLGYCAGIRVVKVVKGRPGATTLVRVAPPDIAGADTCLPRLYAVKGERWLVFANLGTSKGGLRYLDSSSDGPSFAANQVPDFDKMESQYRGMQAQIEQAIGDKLR